jgi:hypothetical protein
MKAGAAFAVGRLEARRDGVEFIRRARCSRSRKNQRAAQDVELASRVEVEAGDASILRGFPSIFDALFGRDGPKVGCKRIGVVGDVGRIDPSGAARDDAQVEKVLLNLGNECSASATSDTEAANFFKGRLLVLKVSTFGVTGGM